MMTFDILILKAETSFFLFVKKLTAPKACSKVLSISPIIIGIF